MPLNEDSGRDAGHGGGAQGQGPWAAPRWPTIAALAVSITLGLPLTLWGVTGSGRLPIDRTMKAPVVRVADLANQGTPVDMAEEAEAASAVAEVRLDARNLLDLLRGQDYRIEAIRTGELPVPRVRLASMPRDIGGAISPDERKDLFLKTMLPLVLLENERIERDRTRLQRLHALREAGYSLSPRDQVWLSRLAEQYGLAATEVDTKLLLRRVDIVPVSLTLAQAAEESGWGTSRFAQQGNALFGQLTWSAQHNGIVPRNRQPGEQHRFRSFDDLTGSVRSYMHNLNTHRAYGEFRRQRASLRTKGVAIDGYRLAAHIERYSERGADYIADLRRLIRSNALTDFDRAVLLRDGRELVLHVAPADGAPPEPALVALPLFPEPSPADTAVVQTEDGAF